MPIPLVTRILVADDHALVREGLKHVINAEPDLEVVAEAADGAEAIERALADDIQLAILDISMPRMTGLQAARELSHRRPELRLLMLSMYDNEQFLFEALKAGASGYVLKSGADDDIVEACRAAMRGQSFLYPSAVNTLVRDFLERADQDRDYDPLTPRELEVLKLIAEGKTSKEIARTARAQHQDRRAPPRRHPSPARHARPRRPHPLRDPPRPDRALTAWRQNIGADPPPIWGLPPMSSQALPCDGSPVENATGGIGWHRAWKLLRGASALLRSS